ncbi:MAG: hypothetical protein K6T83_01270 [Alicyclobacillus sp.]|nr:hypothetical protein [Alicyclobacillus sp.]
MLTTTLHIEQRTIHDIVIDPDHSDRTESEVFRKAKERLKEDGHYRCYICGTTNDLQVHHRAAEYMFNNIVDFDKLKEFCEEWDLYGYGRLLKAQPITTVDDIRNQMVLCRTHHTGVDHDDGNSGTGIHNMTFSSWIIQKLAKDGCNPVPQPGETAETAEKRVKEGESH